VEYVWNITDLGYRVEDILWLVEHGLLTLGYQSSSYLNDRVPELGLLDLPFLFATVEEARAAIDGPLGALLAGRIQRRVNYRILGVVQDAVVFQRGLHGVEEAEASHRGAAPRDR
jgi:TRAP-type transport system periplasmic protein